MTSTPPSGPVGTATVEAVVRSQLSKALGGKRGMLEAELYDGSGTITVVWLGRRRIAGIEPGRQIRVVGRIGVHDAQRLMFNPRYELR